jgi:hypothetical protein
MKNIVLLIITTLLTLSYAEGQTSSSIQSLDKFDEIKAYDQINVTLKKSDENRAEISGDDVEEVSIVNKDGRLKVKMEVDNFMDGNETNVTLYHTEYLQLVDVNEGAQIKSDNDLEAKYLTLRAQEGGEIQAKVDARNLDTKSVSGGKIVISGNAENQEIMVRTGGRYHGKELSSSQTDVTVFGGGNAIVNTDEYVEANVTAGGTIEIYGNPLTVNEDKTLGGSIIVRR